MLPFLRAGLPASALVVGSMAPDLPYYLPIHVGRFHPPVTWGAPSHTGWALVTLDLVLGLVAWVTWHAVLAGPAVSVAPAPLRARMAGQVVLGLRCRLAGRRDALLVVVALVVGSATHVGWDELTHADRWGVRHVPLLSTTWAGMEWYRWAQHLGTIGGALALAAWFVRWWCRTPPVPVAALPAPRTLTITAVAGVFAVGAAVGVRAALAADSLATAAFLGASRGGAVIVVLLLALSLLWHRRRPV